MPAGRPRASSRATIEEAAGELFLERGYAATSLTDIAQRAGVGRATLFGYVRAKSDLLWLEVDGALDDFEQRLQAGEPVGEALAAAIAVARIPLAMGQAEAMGVADELAVSGRLRTARLEHLLACADGERGLAARVRQRARAAAISSAWEAWAVSGPARRPLAAYVREALDVLGAGVSLDSAP